MRAYPSIFPATSSNRPRATPAKAVGLAVAAATPHRAGCVRASRLASTMPTPDSAALEECASR